MKNVSKFKKIEYIYHFLMLLLLTGAIIPLVQKINGVDIDAASGDPITQTLVIIGSFFLIFYIFPLRKNLFDLFKNNFFLVALIFLALISFIWSDVPIVTIRKSIALFLTVFLGAVLIIRYSLKDYILLVGRVISFSLILSLVVIVFFQNIGLMHDPSLNGNWCGIFIHKNVLGSICMIGIIIFGYLIRVTSKSKIYWISILILDIVLLLGSRSTTSLIISLAFIIIFIIYFGISQQKWILVAFISLLLIILIISSFWFVSNYEEFFSIFGKDATLTGRVQLWDSAFKVGVLRPWFGYGYKSFWLGLKGPSIIVIKIINWLPRHGHNGYLDLFLELGFVGLSLGLGSIIGGFYRIVHVTKKTIKPSINLCVLFILFVSILLLNTVESKLITQNSFIPLLLFQIILLSNSKLIENSKFIGQH